MPRHVLTSRRRPTGDLCGHCGLRVERVWLVPGDVLNSCRDCFAAAMGREPVHELGHTTAVEVPASPVRPSSSLRTGGRRPA